MNFNGFRSIAEYESECRRLGYTTERIPFSRDGEKYFALITGIAHPTPTSCKSWHLFKADESAEVLDGVIFQSGPDLSQQLLSHGFSR